MIKDQVKKKKVSLNIDLDAYCISMPGIYGMNH